MDGRVALTKFAPREPFGSHTTTQHPIHTFTMKQLFALFAVALLFAAPVSAQDADTTMGMLRYDHDGRRQHHDRFRHDGLRRRAG